MHHSCKVYETKKYDMFKKLNGNRDIKRSHVNGLKKAMEEEDLHYLDPITVSKSFCVIDGQHRLEARKQLNLKVHYVVSEEDVSLDQVQKLNSMTKNWTDVDYFESYCSLGVKDYILLKEFMKIHKIPLGIARVILSPPQSLSPSGRVSRRNILVDFRNGNFKIIDINKSGDVIKKLKQIGKSYPEWKRRCFVLCMLKIFSIPGYNHKRMIEKLEYLSMRMVNCPDTASYLKLMESIYNYKQTPDTKIRFI